MIDKDIEQYNSRVYMIKAKIIKKLTGSYKINEDIKRIIDFKKNYKMKVTDDRRLDSALQILDEIDSSQDLDTLTQISKNIDKEQEESFQKIVSELEESKMISDVCKKEHVKSFTDFKGMNKEDLVKNEGIEIEEKDGVEVYKLKGIEFDLMIHDGDFLGETGKAAGTKMLHTSRISSEIPIYTISRSSSSCNRRYLVFNDVEAKKIEFMTTTDAHIATVEKQTENKKDESELLPEEFLANVNGSYSDYGIDTSDGKLQPDAICIMGEVTKGDIEYAKKRGISAIYSIDEEKYQYKNEEKYKEVLEEYKKDLNPSLIASLKIKNPNDRMDMLDDIYDILKDNQDKELVAANLYALKRTYRIDLKDAKNWPDINNGQQFLDKFEKLEELNKDEEIPKEKIDKFSKIYELEKSIGIEYSADTSEMILRSINEILDNSKNPEKDIETLITVIKDNANLEERNNYLTILGACNIYNKQKNNSSDKIREEIVNTKAEISVANLTEKGRKQRNESLDIYKYFEEPSKEADVIVEKLKGINIQKENEADNHDIVKDTIEETEKSTRIGDINKEAQIIKSIIKDRSIDKNNENEKGD